VCAIENHLFIQLSKMSNQKKDATKRRFGNIFGSHSPSPHRKSDPNTEKTKNCPATTPPDDNTDAPLNMKTAAKDSNKDMDLWTIAEKTLRQDGEKRKKLEEYDHILEDYIGSKLKPVGTLERRKQFLGFFNSEIEKLIDADRDSDTLLGACSRKAKRCFKMAVTCVVASKDIIAPATTPCLPAAVACTGVVILLSVSLRLSRVGQY
jgi:hypothetical protein